MFMHCHRWSSLNPCEVGNSTSSSENSSIPGGIQKQIYCSESKKKLQVDTQKLHQGAEITKDRARKTCAQFGQSTRRLHINATWCTCLLKKQKLLQNNCLRLLDGAENQQNGKDVLRVMGIIIYLPYLQSHGKSIPSKAVLYLMNKQTNAWII